VKEVNTRGRSRSRSKSPRTPRPQAQQHQPAPGPEQDMTDAARQRTSRPGEQLEGGPGKHARSGGGAAVYDVNA